MFSSTRLFSHNLFYAQTWVDRNNYDLLFIQVKSNWKSSIDIGLMARRGQFNEDGKYASATLLFYFLFEKWGKRRMKKKRDLDLGLLQ